MKDARRAMERKERTNDDSKKIRNDGIRKKGGKGKTTTTKNFKQKVAVTTVELQRANAEAKPHGAL